MAKFTQLFKARQQPQPQKSRVRQTLMIGAPIAAGFTGVAYYRRNQARLLSRGQRLMRKVVTKLERTNSESTLGKAISPIRSELIKTCQEACNLLGEARKHAQKQRVESKNGHSSFNPDSHRQEVRAGL